MKYVIYKNKRNLNSRKCFAETEQKNIFSLHGKKFYETENPVPRPGLFSDNFLNLQIVLIHRIVSHDSVNTFD